MLELERIRELLYYSSPRAAVGISPIAIVSALCLIILVYWLEQYVKLRSVWKAIPTRVFVIAPMSLLSNFLPRSKWNPTILFTWIDREILYASSEIICVSGALKGASCLYASSPEVIRQILATRAPFSKPSRAKDTVGFMGTNVIASDGDTWKTHRTIVAPAFSHEGYKQVWAETMRTYQEMWTVEGWDTRETVSLSNTYLITKKLALFIVASCGFNIPLAWADGDTDKDGRMSLYAVLKTVSNSILIRYLTPRWVYYLPIQSLRIVDTAYKHLEIFLYNQISLRKEDIRDELNSGMDPLEAKRDLFSRLVAASVNEGKLGLTDREINGNTFIMLFAGHETTAHTLAVTLILLGLYEEEQERLYTHIVGVLGDRVPTFEDYDTLEPVVLPVIYESLRLYPAVFLMIRKADEDTSLSIPEVDGSGTTELLIPKGTEIMLDFIGSNYNRRCYPDADSFKPLRFQDRMDTSLAFSYGPRTCLGRKFATTEMVCFLSLMLRDWKVEVVRDVGETREQWRERVMRPTFGIAMIMPDLPLRLVRRGSK